MMPPFLFAWLRGDARPLSKSELSQIISFARITLVVGLVFLHYGSYPNSVVSPFHGLDVHSHPFATGINSFVLFCFFSVVPLLSMISGWLFFSFESDVPAALIQRIRRRFSSLYLPLVFWNLLFLAILSVLYNTVPSHPLLSEINIDFSHAARRQYANAVLAVTQHPVGFQFWFVRDLFVTALVSPILFFFLETAPVIGAAILGLSWIFDFNLWIFFRTDVAFFFFLGGLLRRKDAELHIGRDATVVFTLTYLGLMALRTLAPYVTDNSGPGVIELLDAATRASRVVGVLACWGMFQRAALTGTGAAIARFGSFAFFLHAIHYPMLAEIKIALWRVLPSQSDAWMLLHYAICVVLTVAFGVGVGVLLARNWPRAFALMNGGRPAST